MVASVIILLSNRTLMPLKHPVYAVSQIFCLFKLVSQVFNSNNFSSVFAIFCRYISYIFCHDFDCHKNCTQIALTPKQRKLFFDQWYIYQFLQLSLQHRFIWQSLLSLVLQQLILQSTPPFHLYTFFLPDCDHLLKYHTQCFL